MAIGHGIDTGMFHCASRPARSDKLNILAVGRITKIKNFDILIKAAKILSEPAGQAIKVNIVGGPATRDDEVYLKYLKKLTSDLQLESVICFVGPVPYSQIVTYYCQSDLAVNLCPTGGIDKAALEAMACGVPCLVANEAFAPYLGPWRDKLSVAYNNPADLAQKILALTTGPEQEKLSSFLRRQVDENHNVKILIKKIIDRLP